MERFFKRKFSSSGSGSGIGNEPNNTPQGTTQGTPQSSFQRTPHNSSTPLMPSYVDLDNLPCDPIERIRISHYHPNQIDEVRRKYLIKGPCQPRTHQFPRKLIANVPRRFNPAWFDQYGNWLEYSVKGDKAFCLCCYLFRENFENQAGSDAFMTESFSSWNKTERLASHVGDVNSFHNNALKKCDDLMRQNQSIAVAFHKHSDATKNEYRIRLNASIDVSRILHQGLSYRGHDESEESTYWGNFLEFLKYTASQNEMVAKVVLKNAPGNNQMIAPYIQKEIAYCFGKEIVNSILEDIDGDVFGLLIDESSDVSSKEQMAMILRYVDKCGIVKERFVGIVHVQETSSLCLKSAVDSLLYKHGLSLKNVRGQGYDGASNMQGEFNGLRALILRENSSSYYVHCFAHQLQLVIVAVAKNHLPTSDFFEKLSLLLNVVGASCKRRDMLRESYQETLVQAMGVGDIQTGMGLNQELDLQRPGNTRWGSHFKTLLHVVDLFPNIMEVLEYIEIDGHDNAKKAQSYGLLIYLQSFKFVFYLHLMLLVLGISNSLSVALQKKDQDILNAISLVVATKRELQNVRDDGKNSLLQKISCFCEKHDLAMVNMEDEFVDPRRPRKKTNMTNLQHFQVDCFYPVLDMLLQEFNDRFNEVNSELLICMASLSPIDSFSAFDSLKLIRLSEFYPYDFSSTDRMTLEYEFKFYINNVKADGRFGNLKDISDLARVMVQTKKHHIYPLVYKLLKLALTLPVATATVERCFSAMKIVKINLCNRISDNFLSDCLISFIEKYILDTVTNEVVMDRFQKMKNRREQL